MPRLRLKIPRLFAELQHDQALVYQPYLLSKIENVDMREWIAFALRSAEGREKSLPKISNSLERQSENDAETQTPEPIS
jgi:hypothetical protein